MATIRKTRLAVRIYDNSNKSFRRTSYAFYPLELEELKTIQEFFNKNFSKLIHLYWDKNIKEIIKVFPLEYNLTLGDTITITMDLYRRYNKDCDITDYSAYVVSKAIEWILPKLRELSEMDFSIARDNIRNIKERTNSSSRLLYESLEEIPQKVFQNVIKSEENSIKRQKENLMKFKKIYDRRFKSKP